jgi:D-3-phosphoglycerate dehydrogenase
MLATLEAHDAIEVMAPGNLEAADLVAALPGVHAVIVRSNNHISAAVLAHAPDLRVIGRAGTGVDNIDVADATRRGIAVLNTPGANANATAEHTIGMMLALARHIPAAHRSLLAGQWNRSGFRGRELRGRTLGLIGVGRVGNLVATQATALGMQVLAYDPYRGATAADPFTLVDLGRLLSSSDVVSMHAPLTDATHHLLDAAAFRQMQRGALVINCARGGLVDEDALVDAIQEGHIDGAALDVFESEPVVDRRLLQLPQVIATPHLGGSTAEAQAAVGQQIAAQIVAFLLHGEMQFCVNAPALSQP